jgi:hypothetical protein
MEDKRRAILKAGVAAGPLFLTLPYAWVWAQSEGTMKLLKAPKVALVLGNSKYKESPLKNPANDAKAIAEALKSSGFEVTLMMDAGKVNMAAAVQAYVKTLAARKCVGLFYYAGHGIQLAWKNYMLPVDADIDTIGDVQKQAAEVNALMEGLTKAGNPMNVIILDACRDNPFGNLKGVDHKGLSQMDAPNNTIISYATAPGNVASDGDGANGLYTENFLKEIKVPDAKVEDVFKRVRLNVRVKSKGAQVPWDSSSLEDDFYFLPPKELKKLSDAEKDKAFQEQLAAWEKVQNAAQPAPLEEFLRRYPNGDYSELAQLRLDRVLARQGEKKIQIVSAEGNPYTKGSSEANTKARVGDTYTYRILDLFSKAERRRVVESITQVTENEVVYDSGIVTDLLGNFMRTRDGRSFTPRQQFPLEYAVGKRWTSRYTYTTGKGEAGRAEASLVIGTRESITVPAGSFDTFRVDSRAIIEGIGPGGRNVETLIKFWMAPALLRRWVAYDELRRVMGTGNILEASRQELVSFKES